MTKDQKYSYLQGAVGSSGWKNRQRRFFLSSCWNRSNNTPKSPPPPPPRWSHDASTSPSLSESFQDVHDDDNEPLVPQGPRLLESLSFQRSMSEFSIHEDSNSSQTHAATSLGESCASDSSGEPPWLQPWLMEITPLPQQQQQQKAVGGLHNIGNTTSQETSSPLKLSLSPTCLEQLLTQVELEIDQNNGVSVSPASQVEPCDFQDKDTTDSPSGNKSDDMSLDGCMDDSSVNVVGQSDVMAPVLYGDTAPTQEEDDECDDDRDVDGVVSAVRLFASTDDFGVSATTAHMVSESDDEYPQRQHNQDNWHSDDDEDAGGGNAWPLDDSILAPQETTEEMTELNAAVKINYKTSVLLSYSYDTEEEEDVEDESGDTGGQQDEDSDANEVDDIDWSDALTLLFEEHEEMISSESSSLPPTLLSQEQQLATISTTCCGTPLLPPEVWALVVTDYLAYQELMQFSVSCSSFLHDVLPLVPRLFLSHARELHAAQARRFANVKEIRIYSYIRHVPKQQQQQQDAANDIISTPSTIATTTTTSLFQKLCPETAARIVPFLMQFPKLESVFVGGVLPGRRTTVLARGDHALQIRTRYDRLGHPRGGDDIFRVQRGQYPCEGVCTAQDLQVHSNLVRAFCGAFRAGVLSQDLYVHGIVGGFQCVHESRSCQGLCRLVCESFPLSHVAWLAEDGDFYEFQTCVPFRERLAIIHRRRGGDEFLASPERFHRLFYRCYEREVVQCCNNSGLEKESNRIRANFFEPNAFDEMEELRDKYGCDPAKVSEQSLRRVLALRDQPIEHESHRRLMQIGFNIPSDYFRHVLAPNQWSLK